MIDMRRLSDDLTEAFIWYQHRLDNPFLSSTKIETEAVVRAKYMNDPIFHTKVQSLVVGVMDIVSRNVAAEKKAAQPALEVDVLVEALELISDTDPDEGTAWFHEIAYKALEAYRKGSDV